MTEKGNAAENLEGQGTGEGEGAGEEKGTALEEGKEKGTALEKGNEQSDADAPLEIPDKFKGENGKLNEQGILKSYGELEKTLGSQGKPPESADDYKIETKFPEGVKLDEEAHKEFLGRCHEKGMTNDMVQFLMDEYAGVVGNAVDAHMETREDTVTQLKELYGNDYHDKMADAMNAFKAAAVEGVDIKDVGNNPAMIQILAVLGANLTEDQLPTHMQTVSGAMSEAELESLMKSEAYTDAKHADHKSVLEKVTKHFQSKFREKK